MDVPFPPDGQEMHAVRQGVPPLHQFDAAGASLSLDSIPKKITYLVLCLQVSVDFFSLVAFSISRFTSGAEVRENECCCSDVGLEHHSEALLSSGRIRR